MCWNNENTDKNESVSIREKGPSEAAARSEDCRTKESGLPRALHWQSLNAHRLGTVFRPCHFALSMPSVVSFPYPGFENLEPAGCRDLLMITAAQENACDWSKRSGRTPASLAIHHERGAVRWSNFWRSILSGEAG